jgi:hypothetical protein
MKTGQSRPVVQWRWWGGDYRIVVGNPHQCWMRIVFAIAVAPNVAPRHISLPGLEESFFFGPASSRNRGTSVIAPHKLRGAPNSLADPSR